MLETVKTLLFRGEGDVAVHECRRCGTSVESAQAECPACGSADIATLSTT